jgi:signal transduction histidine kinase
VRRRLTVVSLAVTSMVVLAFVVPLGILVRDLAADRAVTAAERQAEEVARFLAVVAPARGIDQAVAAVGDGGEFPMSIVLPDESIVGEPMRHGEDVTRAQGGTAFRAPVAGGQAVYVPVLLPSSETLVVRVFVTSSELREGVALSWVTLGLLAIGLVAIAVAIADRLARSVVVPVRELSSVAARLGEGDLDARVDPSGPGEIRDVGAEFNRLAVRIEQLLQQERETAADLSHRLRTPLTAVRLDAEGLAESADKQRLLDDLSDLERHVDFVIKEARREVRRRPGAVSDLAAVVADRVAFWSVLAEEQGRSAGVEVASGPATVAIPEQDTVAMVDALIGNVFAHTDDGVGFDVGLSVAGDLARLTVEDAGLGFSDLGLVERGRSGGSGTGLGLDIVRRTAESAGGRMAVGRSGLGGARIEVEIPVAV